MINAYWLCTIRRLFLNDLIYCWIARHSSDCCSCECRNVFIRFIPSDLHIWIHLALMSEDLVDNIMASLRCFFSVCLSWELQKENNSEKKKRDKKGRKQKIRGDQGPEQELFFVSYQAMCLMVYPTEFDFCRYLLCWLAKWVVQLMQLSEQHAHHHLECYWNLAIVFFGDRFDLTRQIQIGKVLERFK